MDGYQFPNSGSAKASSNVMFPCWQHFPVPAHQHGVQACIVVPAHVQALVWGFQTEFARALATLNASISLALQCSTDLYTITMIFCAGCGEQPPSLQTYRGDEKQSETVRLNFNFQI